MQATKIERYYDTRQGSEGAFIRVTMTDGQERDIRVERRNISAARCREEAENDGRVMRYDVPADCAVLPGCSNYPY